MRTNGGVIAEREAVFFGNDAKVIEHEFDLARRNGPANFILHRAENLLSVFNARARRRADVQAELSSIHGREEIPPHPRQRQERTPDDQGEHDEHRWPIHQSPAQDVYIKCAERFKPTHETVLEAIEPVRRGVDVTVLLVAQDVFHQHRNQRSAEHITG